MIIIESKRKQTSTLQKQYPNAMIIDVTSEDCTSLTIRAKARRKLSEVNAAIISN